MFEAKLEPLQSGHLAMAQKVPAMSRTASVTRWLGDLVPRRMELSQMSPKGQRPLQTIQNTREIDGFNRIGSNFKSSNSKKIDWNHQSISSSLWAKIINPFVRLQSYLSASHCFATASLNPRRELREALRCAEAQRFDQRHSQVRALQRTGGEAPRSTCHVLNASGRTERTERASDTFWRTWWGLHNFSLSNFLSNFSNFFSLDKSQISLRRDLKLAISSDSIRLHRTSDQCPEPRQKTTFEQLFHDLCTAPTHWAQSELVLMNYYEPFLFWAAKHVSIIL